MPSAVGVRARRSKTHKLGSRMARASARTGVSAPAVHTLPFDLSALDNDGILVNVDTTGFRALQRRMSWDDLGITIPKGHDVLLRQPRWGLYPKRYLHPLQTPAGQAHDALSRWSFRFQLVETVLGSSTYRWIPWTAWEKFEAEMAAAKAHLGEARASVRLNFEAIKSEMELAFFAIAKESAERLKATGAAPQPDFVDRVVKGFLAAMPTPEWLDRNLAISWNVGVLMLGSEMQAEQKKAAKNLAEAQAARAEAEVVEHKVAVEKAAITEAAKREAEVKAKLAALKVEAAKEKLAQAVSPLEEGARQLQAAIYEAAQEIRRGMEKNGYLHGRSCRHAKDLAAWFRMMNWREEKDLAGLVTELERLASVPGTGAPPPIDELNKVIADITKLTYAGARRVLEPSRMSALEL